MSPSSESVTELLNDNPRHIAIIMDGNGRWAQKRFMPRIIGHRAGVKTVRKIVEFCVEQKIEALTLFAFSSENWRRPAEEVSLLMNLFVSTLQAEIKRLHENNIRLRFIGDLSAFSSQLRDLLLGGMDLTSGNDGLNLIIAANYGGRWDVAQSVKQIAHKVLNGEMSVDDISAEHISKHLVLADLPEPDLFIRTGGEQRISNFLLWQLAYTELYFTDELWPDFDGISLQKAILSYKKRERRFGQTSDQVSQSKSKLSEKQ